MTREEAIALLNEQYETCKRIYDCSADQRKSYPNVPQFMEALGMALSALRPVSREQVEKVWRGEWELVRRMAASIECKCPKCQRTVIFTGKPANFCEKCGSANTDKAVEMVMERLEVLESDARGTI